MKFLLGFLEQFKFSYLILFQENKKLTVAQRRDNLEKGPHNLIFHGMEPDWIEAEMDDDPDFIKDVIGQRMRNMIKVFCILISLGLIHSECL